MSAGYISIILGIASGMIQLFGYVIYLKLNKGDTNAGSWLIWTLSAGIDLYSYDYITKGDLIKEILPITCAVACIVTFMCLLVRGHFRMPDKTDWRLISFDTLISIVWWQNLVSAIAANIMLQVTTLMSAVPMIRGIISGKEEENPIPWAIWSTAYMLQTGSVILRLDHWSELAYPVSNAISHLAILYAAVQMQRSPR